MTYGLRDTQTGQVHWQRKGIPPWLAKRFHAAGCVLLGWDWVASLKEYRAHMSFVGESWPQIDETEPK